MPQIVKCLAIATFHVTSITGTLKVHRITAWASSSSAYPRAERTAVIQQISRELVVRERRKREVPWQKT
jgi:hypothetical protein